MEGGNGCPAPMLHQQCREEQEGNHNEHRRRLANLENDVRDVNATMTNMRIDVAKYAVKVALLSTGGMILLQTAVLAALKFVR